MEVNVAAGKSKRIVIHGGSGSEPELDQPDDGEESLAGDGHPLLQKLSEHNINKCIAVIVLNPDIAAEVGKRKKKHFKTFEKNRNFG